MNQNPQSIKSRNWKVHLLIIFLGAILDQATKVWAVKEFSHTSGAINYNHTIQVIDTLESLRDVLGGMLDLYLSTISNKMNEVMKVLTIMATIFIPLTFIAGIYGMNFRYMPELEWHWGYFMVWGIMVLVVLVMVAYFKKKTWL